LNKDIHTSVALFSCLSSLRPGTVGDMLLGMCCRRQKSTRQVPGTRPSPSTTSPRRTPFFPKKEKLSAHPLENSIFLIEILL
jgi:hypothetical protein